MNKPALHQAVLRGDTTAVLSEIRKGVDLSALDDNGQSALHWAVFRGDYETAQLLLEAGADPNVMSKDGVTPCWRAMDFGLTEVERLLRSHGGDVATGAGFNRRAFTAFGNLIGQPIPKEDDK